MSDKVVIVDFETHFYPEEYIQYLRSRTDYPKFSEDSKRGLLLEYDSLTKIPRQSLLGKFTDAETRMRDMLRAKVDLQVLSVPLPGVDKLDSEASLRLCKIANDGLAEVCRSKPTQFCGFALLPMQAGEEAVDELRRAVLDLGLKGGYVHSNSNGDYLDSEPHFEVMSEASKLGVPIFVHPTVPRSYESMEHHRLATTFGLQFDLSLSILRLIFSGSLESLPGLKLIVSHLGSTLSFISNRIDDEFEFARAPETKIREKPSTFLRKLYVDTVTMDKRPLEFATSFFGAKHIVFGSDYPFWDTSLHVKAVEESSLSNDDKDWVFSKTALGLLKL